MTLRLTQKRQPSLLAWAAERDGRPGGTWPLNAVALGVTEIETDTLRAVTILVRTYEASCDIHFASDGSRGWATRNILSGLFGYAFLLLGVERLQGLISVRNMPALIMARKAGFSEIGIIPKAMPAREDGVLFSMLAEHCRWINEKELYHGRR